MTIGPLPNLAAAIVRRFDVQAGRVTAADGFPPNRHPLMTPLLPQHMFFLHDLSPVAKLDRFGQAQKDWPYELPPMEVVEVLVQPYHITGVDKRTNYPFALKAIGPVDAGKILQGGKGFITDRFTVVP